MTPSRDKYSDLDAFLATFGRAGEIVRMVQKSYRDCHAGKQPGHEVALYIAAPFGTFRAHTLFAQTPSVLLMNIQTDEGHPDILYCPVEQAAFLIRHYVPRDDKDKVLVGFGAAMPK